VFYGAAEFSRDLDLLVLAGAGEMNKLTIALRDLEAEPIAFPPFTADYLERGHAAHFRCRRADLGGLRIDLMSVLRGVASFEELWQRRTTLEVAGETVDLLGLEDLVRAKKTQRDKDWPMLRRLVERSYFTNRDAATPELASLWLRELRTPELLIAVAAAHPVAAREAGAIRPATEAAVRGAVAEVVRRLAEEERHERERDREYWKPLKQELEQLRRGRA
jgi:hypothetical protein